MQPTFTNFLGVYSSELDHLKKLEENLTEVKAKRKEIEGKNKRLIQLNEEQNRIHTKHYEERIAKVSVPVHLL
jgi:hypothetical protein